MERRARCIAALGRARPPSSLPTEFLSLYEIRRRRRREHWTDGGSYLDDVIPRPRPRDRLSAVPLAAVLYPFYTYDCGLPVFCPMLGIGHRGGPASRYPRFLTLFIRTWFIPFSELHPELHGRELAKADPSRSLLLCFGRTS